VTNLPDSALLREVFARIDELLTSYANAPAGHGTSNVVEAGGRFK
jgi:hypothetical protein